MRCMAHLKGIKALSGATIGLIVAVLSTVFSDTGQAVTLITNRADLGGNDSVNWTVLGPPSTDVSNPFSLTSLGGIMLDISQPVGSFSRRNQSWESWAGMFAPGDALLFTGGSNQGSITIDFDVPVLGAGTQFQTAVEGDPYIAMIEAFDSVGNSLGLVGLSGISQFGLEGDNSAIFVGVRSDTANIDKLKLTVVATRVQDPGFAINQLDLATTNEAEPIPEPTTAVAVLALGSSAIFAKLWRKRR